MYENMTFESILTQCLGLVPGDTDKSEGSIIYDALAPACFELAKMYTHLSEVDRISYADKAYGEYLDRRVLEQGVLRKQAVKAIRKGKFNKDIPIGSRFAIEELIFVVMDKIEDHIYKMVCDTAGKIGNKYTGEMIAIDYIEGLEYAKLNEILIAGEEAETDEDLRERYFAKIRMPATSGNAYHYKLWATEVEGVGDAKVFPLWNGPGTVKVLITNSDKGPATLPLITKVENYIDKVRPIGANVTVAAPTAKLINIEVKIVVGTNVYLSEVKETFRIKLEEYFKRATFAKSIISYALIGGLLLDVEGVADYSDLKLNQGIANIRIEEDEVPVLGGLTVNEL